jgi:hypothetical protein
MMLIFLSANICCCFPVTPCYRPVMKQTQAIAQICTALLRDAGFGTRMLVYTQIAQTPANNRAVVHIKKNAHGKNTGKNYWHGCC